MRILLDECLPRRLKWQFPGHDVTTVPEAGWAGRKNGDLLQLMTGLFDIFITIDRGIAFQQQLADRPFAVLLLQARSNRLADLLPLVPALTEALKSAQPGDVIRIGA